MKRLTIRLVLLAAVLALWESAFRAGVINPLILGAPSLVAAAALKDGPAFMSAFQVTLGEMAIATGLAWIGGVTLGTFVGARLRTARIFSPLFSAAIAVPLVVLYPVFVAWFGLGPPSKIVYGAAAGFFPVSLATVSGVSSIDQSLVEMAKAMGARPSQLLAQVMVRLALPSILSGLRIGASIAIISVVQSEMLSSTEGLGFLISYNRSLFNVGQVYLGILLVLLAAYAANLSLSAIERHFGRWRALEQAGI